MSEIITTLHDKQDNTIDIYPNIKKENIPNNAIETAKINDSAVTTAKINDGAITSAKISSNAITETEINTNAVSTSKIQNDAVTTAKINDGAVTTIKIDDGAITNNKIALLTITGDKLVNGTINDSKIANNSIGASKLDFHFYHYDIAIKDSNYNIIFSFDSTEDIDFNSLSDLFDYLVTCYSTIAKFCIYNPIGTHDYLNANVRFPDSSQLYLWRSGQSTADTIVIGDLTYVYHNKVTIF